MRSLAAALSLKRSKRSEASQPSADPSSAQSVQSRQTHHVPKSRPTFVDKAPKTQVITDASPRLRPPLNPGSSSSSEGSASIRTPEDDAVIMFPQTEPKRRWSNWLGLSRPPQRAATTMGTTASAPSDRRPGKKPSRMQEVSSDTDEDDETVSESSSSAEGITTSSRLRPMVTSGPNSRANSTLAISNLKALFRNSLLPPLSPPPLVDVPTAHQFPRSSNKSKKLPFVHSMESQMHIRILLRRLERGRLSRMEVASIEPFSAREKPSGPVRPVKKSDDDPMAFSSMRVGPLSRGLRRWVRRPCFEERVLVWTADKMGNVACTKVLSVGRGLAVAELEFSERVEEVAGFCLDDDEFDATLRSPVTRTQPAPRRPLSRPPVTNPHAASRQKGTIPSPLSTVARTSSSLPRSGGPRGVRFADHLGDSDDDNIPLGQAILSRREQEERLRRVQEDKVEAEKRRAIEEEERERAARAKMEREERAKVKYAEEYAAARQRIESQRAGAENYHAYREARAREREPSYSRPKYDSSQSRSPATHANTSETDLASRAGSSRNNSPGNSRPVSIYSPPSIDSRRSSVIHGPPLHAASVEDLNARRGRRKSVLMSQLGNGYPLSEASSSRMSLPRSNSSPVTGFMYPGYVYSHVPVPPVPQMPWAMPLLPPMPAFMLDSYPSSPASTPSRESSPSRQQFPGVPMVGAGYYGMPQAPPVALPRPSVKGGSSEVQVQPRQPSHAVKSERDNTSSRKPYALPSSYSSKELRQVPNTESTSRHARTSQYNRRTSLV